MVDEIENVSLDERDEDDSMDEDLDSDDSEIQRELEERIR